MERANGIKYGNEKAHNSGEAMRGWSKGDDGRRVRERERESDDEERGLFGFR